VGIGEFNQYIFKKKTYKGYWNLARQEEVHFGKSRYSIIAPKDKTNNSNIKNDSSMLVKQNLRVVLYCSLGSISTFTNE
jgi:hypothetical protein